MWLAPPILSVPPEGGEGGGGGEGDDTAPGRIISWHVTDTAEYGSQLAALQACWM